MNTYQGDPTRIFEGLLTLNKDEDGNTILHRVILAQNDEVIKLIIDKIKNYANMVVKLFSMKNKNGKNSYDLMLQKTLVL